MAYATGKVRRATCLAEASFLAHVKGYRELVWGLFPFIGAAGRAVGCQSYALIVID